MNWTQPICARCYTNRYPDRQPACVLAAEPELCCDCGEPTQAGIYFRVDPRTVKHPAPEPAMTSRPAAPVRIGSLDDALKYAEFLEAERDRLTTALSLAQTEIKGHMRVEDDLRADLAAEAPARFQLQAALGRAQDKWQEAQSRIAELEKDAARYRFIRRRAYVAGNGWMFSGSYPPIDQYAYNLKGKAALDDCDASIDAALKSRA